MINTINTYPQSANNHQQNTMGMSYLSQTNSQGIGNTTHNGMHHQHKHSQGAQNSNMQGANLLSSSNTNGAGSRLDIMA